MGSTRLPGKVLMDIGGKPALLHVIERVTRVTSVKVVVVATSREPQDDAIADACAKWNVACYRGSEQDVLDRFYRAAALSNLSAVVRITADCPLLDPAVVEQVIQKFYDTHADYCSNVQPPTFPDGLDCEVVRMEALEAAWDEAAEQVEREHVMPYIYRHPDRFRVANLSSTGDHSALRWTLDTQADLEHIRRLYKPDVYDYRLLLQALTTR